MAVVPSAILLELRFSNERGSWLLTLGVIDNDGKSIGIASGASGPPDTQSVCLGYAVQQLACGSVKTDDDGDAGARSVTSDSDGIGGIVVRRGPRGKE